MDLLLGALTPRPSPPSPSPPSPTGRGEAYKKLNDFLFGNWWHQIKSRTTLQLLKLSHSLKNVIPNANLFKIRTLVRRKTNIIR